MTSKHIVLIALALFPPQDALGRSFFASPQGSSTGDGTQSDPWNIETALKHPADVAAGDTIQLLAGTYQGHFVSSLTGTSSSPIIVKPFGQDLVIIDGNTGVGNATALILNGSNTHYLNFHVTSSDTKRDARSNSIQITNGIDVFGSNLKLIHLSVYDNVGNGIGFWSTSTNSEIYGCLIYHNGYQDNSRGHGHGIYMQNATGTKLVRDNYIFNNFQYGVHAYTEGGSITGFHIESNICFNNGLLQASGVHKSNILVGGLKPADRVVIKNNHLLHPFNKSVSVLELGYGPINGSATITGNVLYGGNPTSKINRWLNISFTKNTVLGAGSLTQILDEDVDSKLYSWNENQYYGGSSTAFDGSSYANWKSLTGFDLQSTSPSTMPTSNQIHVFPSQYQSGRGHFLVYNWELLNSVSVDLSTILSKNSTYAVYDIQNIKGSPLLTGTYTGQNILIPMNTTALTLPNGVVPILPSHTGIDFGAFVVLSPAPALPDPIGILEHVNSHSLEIYPSPASNDIRIELGSMGLSEPLSVQIYGMDGVLKMSQSFPSRNSSNSIHMKVNELRDGLYIVKSGLLQQRLIISH